MKVNQNFIILDTETGGFSPSTNPLTQLSFIVVDGFNFEEKLRFDSYIKPYDDSLYINSQAAQITGVTKEKCIEEGRDLGEVLDEFCSILKSCKVSYYLPVLVGHNLSFDLMYLEDVFNREYGKNSGKNGTNKLYDYVLHTTLDTMTLSRLFFINDEVPNFKQESIGEKLNVINSSAHNSLADVEQCLGIFKHFMLKMRNGSIESSNMNSEDNNFPPFQF